MTCCFENRKLRVPLCERKKMTFLKKVFFPENIFVKIIEEGERVKL
jgi:hypothetical protein